MARDFLQINQDGAVRFVVNVNSVEYIAFTDGKVAIRFPSGSAVAIDLTEEEKEDLLNLILNEK